MRKEEKRSDVIKFNQLPIELQDHFIKMYYACAGIILVGIIATIFTQFSISIFTSSLLVALIIAIPNTYNIYRCLEGNIEAFEGLCIDISVGKRNKRSIMTIRTDDNYFIQIAIPKKAKYEKNNLVALYCPKNSIYLKTPDSGMANNYYLIHKKKIDGTTN